MDTISTVTIAGWIAPIAFWMLIGFGVWRGDLSGRAAAIFVVLWAAGYVGIPRIAYWAGSLVISFTAILDIVLVFIVLKGDLKPG